MRKDGVLRYLHGDGALHPLREHLGSVGLVTDADGTVANRQGYHAYGKQRHGDDLLTDHGFTAPKGPPKQDGTGLIYMNARYYDPEIGQFIGCPWARIPSCRIT